MVQDRQILYAWRPKGMDPGLENFPGYIAAGSISEDLPRDERFDNERELEQVWDFIIGNTNRGLFYYSQN